MDFIIKNSEAIFYAGAFIIIFGFGWFIYDEIKEDEGIFTEVFWEENKKLIIVSIILMVLGIILWRELYLFILEHLLFLHQKYIQTIKNIQEIING